MGCICFETPCILIVQSYKKIFLEKKLPIMTGTSGPFSLICFLASTSLTNVWPEKD